MPSTTSMMRAALFAASSASAAAVLESRQMTTTTCADVHMFLARGNSEPYPGRQKVLVAEVCDRVANCDYEDIVMNNYLDSPYCAATYEGATKGYDAIVAYNKRCPDAKLVLTGYSQGGHVISDILGGGHGTFFNECYEDQTPQLDRYSAAGQMVKAVTTFGNVRHTANQPYNYGTGSANDSSNPRGPAEQALLNTYADVWRDYCAIGDPVCAHGNVREDHTNYFDIYTYGAAEYIVSLLKAADASSSSATMSATSSSAVSSATLSVEASTTSSSVEASATVSSSSVSSSSVSSSVAASATSSSTVSSSAEISSTISSSTVSSSAESSSTVSSSVQAAATSSGYPMASVSVSSTSASSASASSASVSSASASSATASSSVESSATLSSYAVSHPTVSSSSAAAPSVTRVACGRKHKRATRGSN
ncbi:uncharacterized protein JN550_013710 [Neoarthrinium moseri]|uniref:uncharacterized protein n=1 Tax=Neoarthrinium moseri TaxID=1658444 RepID=UPI001FDE46FD|nr:uncharacterized protein JN550_013710 [Neoarthrinium moseri]KAI1856692.1 hypothetical protein JN550_013710 [Neoarthrinium moseri]